MIRITVRYSESSGISMLESEGHAEPQEGQSLSCGIVSALLRSFVLWVADQPGYVLGGDAGRRGYLRCTVRADHGADPGAHAAASSFLLRALGDLALAAPDDIVIKEEKDKEKYNGT